MNLSDFTSRADVQDSDHFVGYRSAVAGGEGRWTWAVIRANLAALFTPLAHASDTANPHVVTKTQVGLGAADNTSDVDKPVSTAAQTALDGKVSTVTFTTHTSDTANPHSVTKAQVGLGAVDNTSDVDKPVSSAQSAAIAAKIDLTEKGAANGVASLDESGKVPAEQLPGGGQWGEIDGNLSDQEDLQAALDAKAPLASPAFTGTPTGIVLAGVSDAGTAAGFDRGVADGVASLDGEGKVPATQIPDIVNVTKSADYTFTAADNRSRFVATAALTFTLPSVGTLGEGWEVVVVNDSGGTVDFDGPGATDAVLNDGDIASVLEINSKQRVIKGPSTTVS